MSIALKQALHGTPISPKIRITSNLVWRSVHSCIMPLISDVSASSYRAGSCRRGSSSRSGLPSASASAPHIAARTGKAIIYT